MCVLLFFFTRNSFLISLNLLQEIKYTAGLLLIILLQFSAQNKVENIL